MEPKGELLESLKSLYVQHYGEIPKEVKPFITKMQSLYFSPAVKSRKKADQILKFIDIPKGEEFIIQVLEDYKLWEKEMADVVNYSYFVAFLFLKRSEKGIKLLEKITDNLIRENSIFIKLLTPQFFPEIAELDSMRNKISQHIQKFSKECESSKWVDITGIDPPEEWHVAIWFSNAPKEKRSWEMGEDDYILKLRIFGPARGDGNSWYMYLDKGNKKEIFLGEWSEISSDTTFVISGKKLHLKHTPSILDLPGFFQDLENTSGIKLLREPYLLSKSKGIKKNKNIDNWLKGL